jgi:hypothetical protein
MAIRPMTDASKEEHIAFVELATLLGVRHDPLASQFRDCWMLECDDALETQPITDPATGEKIGAYVGVRYRIVAMDEQGIRTMPLGDWRAGKEFLAMMSGATAGINLYNRMMNPTLAGEPEHRLTEESYNGNLVDRVSKWMTDHPTLRKFDPARIAKAIGVAETLVVETLDQNADRWGLVRKIGVKAPTTGTLTDHLFDSEAEARKHEWLRDSSEDRFFVADAELVTVYARRSALE